MTKNYPRKFFILLLCFFLTSAVIFIITHFVISSYDRDEMASYGRHILTRGVEVAAESNDIVNKVNAIQFEACSDKFLDEIRYISFTSVFISDIGFTNDHQLKCTAMRGKLHKPVTMSIPDAVTRYGQRVWTSFNGIVDPRISSDMLESKNVLLFTSPAAFRDIYVPFNGFGAVLINHHKGHVYRMFGETSELLQDKRNFKSFSLWSETIFTECSKKYDICVIAENKRNGIYSLSILAFFFTTLTSLATGGLITFAISQYINNNRSLQTKLRMAMRNEDIYINYQPFVLLDTDEVIGYEALARWRDVNGDSISPEVFIKVAETTNQIKVLTRYVIEHVLEDMEPLLHVQKNMFVSINVTTEDVTDSEFIFFLEQQIDKRGCSRNQIVLEITERSTADHELLKKSLLKLREYGYLIALDDFGTGYSNLDYLSKMSFDFIKIDKIYTDTIESDSPSSNMLKMILQMLTQTSAMIIVEGIEEKHQADFLHQEDLKIIGQGWLYGKPLDINMIIN